MRVMSIPQEITLTAVHQVEGQWVLETDCSDFEHYQSLPQVISYQGVSCGKTGWSSDRNYACYKSGVAIARIEKH